MYGTIQTRLTRASSVKKAHCFSGCQSDFENQLKRYCWYSVENGNVLAEDKLNFIIIIMSGKKFSDASASGGSFPSLDIIYSQEEEEDSFISPFKYDRAKATCTASEEDKQSADPDQTPRANKKISDLYAQVELCRPSDDAIREVTQSDVTQPIENRRQSFLQLVKVCFSKDMTRVCAPAEPNTVAPNTAAAAAAAPDKQNDEESSFLATANVVDLPTNQFRLGISDNIMNINSDDDSTFNLHASTLSRASASTKTSTIGDAIGEKILRESQIASEMTRARSAGQVLVNNAKDTQEDSDNQTLSTYSYKRAYADNITLGSAQTSNFSTITDDFSFEAKQRIGMAEAVNPKLAFNVSPPSGPVDMDTGRPVVMTKDEESASSYPTAGSYPMPPPIFRTNDASNFNLYENHENLQRVVSFGEGEGYVDEEEAARFASLRRGKGGSSGCCNWFSSSPREVKLMLVGSIILLLVSMVSVAIGVMLQQNRTRDAAGFVASSNSVANDVTLDFMKTASQIPSMAPSASLKPSLTVGPSHPSSQAPSTTRTTEPSFTVQVPASPSTKTPTPSPTLSTTNVNVPTTSRPSASPVKSSSSKPTNKPSSVQSPTPEPTTKSPTAKPSKKPTQVPSPAPTKSPPIVEPSPTFNPSSRPTRCPTPRPSSSLTTPAPSRAQPSLSHTIKVRAAQDTYIDSSSMSQNFGTSSRLRVDGSPETRAFVGFDTSSITKAQAARHESPPGHDEPRYLTAVQVLEAKLRLYSVDGGGECAVYFVPNTNQWDETLVTGSSLGNGVNSNVGIRLGSFDDIVACEWQEIDVTEAFTSGTSDFTTFAIKSESSDGVAFASREREAGTFAPELVFTLSGGGGPTPSPETGWPTYSPTVIPSDYPSPKPSRKSTQKVRHLTPQFLLVLLLTLHLSCFSFCSRLQSLQCLLQPLLRQKSLRQVQHRCLRLRQN